MRSSGLLGQLVLVVGALILSGCAADAAAPQDDVSALGDSAQSTGEIAVALPRGSVATAVGALDGKLYVALNNDFGHFLSLDARRLTALDEWGPRHALRLRGADGVQPDGSKLVLLGYDNGLDDDPAEILFGASRPRTSSRFAYVLQWFDPVAKKIDKRLRIELDKNIVGRDGLVDRPNASFAIHGGEVLFAMTHPKVKKLVRIPVPRSGDVVVNQDGAIFDSGLDLPQVVKAIAVDGNVAYLAVPSGSSRGSIETLDLRTGQRARLGQPEYGYPVAVRVAGPRLVVGDHEGRVIVADKASGRIERAEDVGTTLDDLTVDGNVVYAAGRQHFFVTKLRP